MNRYIDTSVLIAYYFPELLSARAERLLRRGGMPAISPLVEIEFASVLGRKVRARELAVGVARFVQERFRDHLDNGMYLRLEIGAAHYEQARRWVEAFKPPLRTLDALHLSIAAGANATLLTADIQLSRAARALRVSCRLLRVSVRTADEAVGRAQ
ncbi:MAG: PIN domain-containing protein [Betaproteobacteria bacterium]|nr:PIN domain-containing protein [Betaproteobacteria bacterium]